MASGKFQNKLQFLYFNLKRIEHFLLFCKDNLPQPWCEQGETHSPSWCEGECSPPKWVSSILKEIIKNIPDKAKIAFFSIRCYKNKIIAENLMTFTCENLQEIFDFVFLQLNKYSGVKLHIKGEKTIMG